MGAPQNRWFTVENTVNIWMILDDLGVRGTFKFEVPPKMGKSWFRQMEICRIRLFFKDAPSQDTGPYLEVSLPIMKSTYKLLDSQNYRGPISRHLPTSPDLFEVIRGCEKTAGSKGGRAEIHWQDFRGLFAR